MSDTGTPPPPASGGAGGRPSELQGEHLHRVLPVAQSVLWHPTSPGVVVRRPPSGAYPVFFDQKAVSAIHAHYETAGRQGMMGFLVGDLYECPTSHVRYVVIDSTIRLNQAVYGDKTLVIVSRLWDRIQDELHKTEGHLIGWYHSHPPIAVELAPGDVETHLQYFKRPWHVALVLGTEHEGPVAGLFRPRPGETSASMPFYELIESDEGFAGGKKRSILPWINFLSDDPAVQYADAHGAAAAAAPQISSPSATLQVVRPGGPKTGPNKAVPTPPPMKAVTAAQPSGPMKAVPVQPSGPVKAVTPPPAPPPAQPSGPVKAVAPGTVARPALGDRLPPSAPVPPPPPPVPPVPPIPPRPMGPVDPRARRDTQMKPPPNALSNLPLISAGGYELGEVESRESAPGVMTPRQSTTTPVPSPAPRRTQGGPAARPSQAPRAFAPALAQRKSDGHPGLVAAFILLLLGGGGFAGWWFLLRHPTPTAPTTTAGTATAATTTAATTPADTTQAAVPPVDSTLLRFERISDSVATVVRNYDTRMRLFGTSQADCGGLSQTLVAVEDAWTEYNVGKRKMAGLDPTQTSRDQSLYAAVDSVERAFDKSGCQRP